jgi:uncharacterized membrane protein
VAAIRQGFPSIGVPDSSMLRATRRTARNYQGPAKGEDARRCAMAEQEQDSLYVIAAAYDDVAAAVADYDSVTELCGALRTPHDFDAVVIAKDENGTVRIVAKHEQPTRRGAAVGVGWGLAKGIVATIFSPVGIGLGIAAAGGAGAAIGGMAGHAGGGRSRGDVDDLGEALDEGRAGLVALLRVEPPGPERFENQRGHPHRFQGYRQGRWRGAADLRQAEAESHAPIPLQEFPPTGVDRDADLEQ